MKALSLPQLDGLKPNTYWYDHTIKQHVITSIQTAPTRTSPTSRPAQVFDGLITLRQIKYHKVWMHYFLKSIFTLMRIILPKSCTLLLLRFTKVGAPVDNKDKEMTTWKDHSASWHKAQIAQVLHMCLSQTTLQNIYGWKDFRVYFHFNKWLVIWTNLPIRSYDPITQGCQKLDGRAGHATCLVAFELPYVQ